MVYFVQGGRQYLKKYRKEMLKVLEFAPEFMDHVHKTQNAILKKVVRIHLLIYSYILKVKTFFAGWQGGKRCHICRGP